MARGDKRAEGRAHDLAQGSTHQRREEGVCIVDGAVLPERERAFLNTLDERPEWMVGALERVDLRPVGAVDHHCVHAAALNGIQRVCGFLEPAPELFDLSE